MNLHITRAPVRGDSRWSALARPLLRARGPAIITLLACSAAALGYFLWQLHVLNRQNADISALLAGEDVGQASQGGEVRLARASFLLARDRFDDAQAAVDAAKPSAEPTVMARMLYNQANANMRRGFAAIEGGKPDAAIPLTKLAKEAYREALRLDPMFWNAKYNYDVAARLMRDFPGYEQEGEDVPPEAEVKLWTDLPGTPQGAP